MEAVVPMRTEPTQRVAFARPRFVLYAVAAFTVFVVLLFTSDWPVAMFFLAPFCVIGCRYVELARFESVHRSRWLLLLIAWTVVMAAMLVLPFDPPIESVHAPWTAGFAVLLLVVGGHLFVVQRHLLEERIERGVQDRSRPCADWVCGGLLAYFPAVFLIGLGDVLAAFSDPWAWLGWSVGVALLVLQLRRNRLFPSLAAICLVVGTIEAGFAWWSAGHDLPALAFAWNFVAMNVPMLVLAAYLLFSSRVRRTFAVARSPDGADAAAVVASR